MADNGGGDESRDGAYLEQRIAHLELLRQFHEEILKVIRIYSSSDKFTSERCLQEIVSFIQKKLAMYMVDVLLVDEVSNELVLYVAAGEEVLNPIVKSFRVKMGEGLAGECARRGEVVIGNDVAQDARFIRGPLVKTQSEMVVPIKVKTRVVGVLDLQDEKKDRFTSDIAQLMVQISFNIGFLLENKKLHDDLREYSRGLEHKVESQVEELQRSEERYKSIVENAADPIFTTDLNGALTWANRATHELLGYDRGEFDGRTISHVVKKGFMHTVFTALREATEGRTTDKVQIKVVRRDSEERTVEFSCSPIREGETMAGVEFTFRDVTAKIVAESLKAKYVERVQEAVNEKTRQIKDTQRAAILAMANLAESIDDDTGGHIQRISHYARVLTEELRKVPKYKDSINDEYIELIVDLSPLHDLGKVGIRDYILQKPDRLTEEEFEKMKEHSEIGYRALHMAGTMVGNEGVFRMAELIAHHHHQKWDGAGYPAVEVNGERRPLRGDEIPLCARVVAMADVYDALTSKRPYKMPFPHEKARDMIVAQGGKHFDPEVVQAFLRREQDFVRIRNQFPDTHMPEGKPFTLPARDAVQQPNPA